MFSIDRSIEGLCIHGDAEKWPLGRMEVDRLPPDGDRGMP